VYPNQLNPLECRALVDQVQTHAPGDIPALLAGGMPTQAQIAHRPGGNFDTRGDAALFHTPGGNYVLVVFLNTANQDLDWATASAIMSDVSRAAYNYFNISR
jgi:hypothetical protein